MSMTAGDLNKRLTAFESRAAEEDRETSLGKFWLMQPMILRRQGSILGEEESSPVFQETSAIKRSFPKVDLPGLTEIRIENEDLWRGSLHGSNSDSGGLLKGMRGSMNVLWGLSALRDLQ